VQEKTQSGFSGPFETIRDAHTNNERETIRIGFTIGAEQRSAHAVRHELRKPFQIDRCERSLEGTTTLAGSIHDGIVRSRVRARRYFYCVAETGRTKGSHASADGELPGVRVNHVEPVG
jgi:hypothetical protein